MRRHHRHRRQPNSNTNDFARQMLKLKIIFLLSTKNQNKTCLGIGHFIDVIHVFYPMTTTTHAILTSSF